MKISRANAFRALKKGRQINRQREQFVVVSLTRKGVPSKMTPSDLNYADTLELAHKRKVALEDMNPTITFVVLDSNRNIVSK